MQTGIAAFRRDDEPDIPTLAITGEIDASVAQDFTDAVSKLVADADLLAVLDLSHVSQFGSTGLTALLAAGALAEYHGVDLVISPSEAVRGVLDSTDAGFWFALPA